MAIFSFNTPLITLLDESDLAGATIVSATATEIVNSNSSFSEQLEGNFTYDGSGDPSGTVTSYSFSEGATLHASVTGLTIDIGAWVNGDFVTKVSLLWGGDDTMNGSSGNDILTSFDGADKLYGYGGNDDLFGGAKNDDLFGGNGRDKLYGESGKDILKGGGAKDKLFGGSGNDKLFGQSGDDRLIGGKGKDKVDGGGGDDKMTGGAGTDIFVFSTGNDIITDFNASNNREKIDLSGVSAITGFQDMKNNHTSTGGGDLIIDDGAGNTLTLIGIELGDLDSGDFIF